MTAYAETIYLERRDPRRNMARYYAFSIEQDLFEGVLTVRRWGRIGTLGRRVSLPCPDRSAAMTMLSAMEKVKRRRGYSEPAR